ncbi:ferredoxin [Phycicoccus sp. HDW14]|uniref:ferredoxin n=1 Tax=Phycicoccus sp. HDW14 TaxID=2714941 RepID=UPI00140CE308|nr:ferredoxin [Phycicoccus sp. HDW14]QIM22565.1 ferredoxin [Phycicoccus sp. HDW14]
MSAAPELRVDRVACTGHGLCATLLPGRIRLDEWGYPVVDDPAVARAEGERAVTFCPARALYWSDRA